MKYIVENIEYDTDGETVDLPELLLVDVPNDLIDEDEISDYVSDDISNQSGFCHNGFTMNKL